MIYLTKQVTFTEVFINFTKINMLSGMTVNEILSDVNYFHFYKEQKGSFSMPQGCTLPEGND